MAGDILLLATLGVLAVVFILLAVVVIIVLARRRAGGSARRRAGGRARRRAGGGGGTLDASTAASYAAPSTASAASARPVLDPQLLMAGRRGDESRLRKLLGLKDDEEQAGDTVEPPAAETGQVQVVVQSEASSSSAEEDIVEVHPRPAAPMDPTVVVDAPAAPSSLLDGVTNNEEDSLLHVVAAAGDGVDFLHCAEMIYDIKEDLLVARNNKGDTPLHRAAAAGNADMLSYLVDLAACVNRLTTILRMRNEHGETVLHQAIRSGDYSSTVMLNGKDPELACIPCARQDGEVVASPLYLAISLGELRIAQYLLDTTEGKLSYSGPDGRNVLHEAASSAYVLSMLLRWLTHMTFDNQEDEHNHHTRTPGIVILSQLANQRDRNGNTPLHLAASLRAASVGAKSPITSLLLDASDWSVYQPDNKGQYPIHVAAMNGNLGVVMTMVRRNPDCATLRDGLGRTLLHVAVESERFNVVGYVCRRPQLKPLLNVQDSEGNTALHLAVHVGNRVIFNRLIRNRAVLLGVPNKKGLRPLDLSRRKLHEAFYYSLNPIVLIQTSLEMMGAPSGGSQPEPMSEKEKKAQDEALSMDLQGATQVMGIVSVLVATVAFASAFTLPGGYIQSQSDGVTGTPMIAGSYAFDAFIFADALAFICSCLATFSLVFAGVPGVELPKRMRYMNMSYDFMRSSVRSMVVAFALGLYLVLAPVALKTAIAVCMITGASFLHGNLEAMQAMSVARTALARWGTPVPAAWIQIAMSFFTAVLKPFWPLIIIFGLPRIWQIKAHHTS